MQNKFCEKKTINIDRTRFDNYIFNSNNKGTLQYKKSSAGYYFIQLFKKKTIMNLNKIIKVSDAAAEEMVKKN